MFQAGREVGDVILRSLARWRGGTHLFRLRTAGSTQPGYLPAEPGTYPPKVSEMTDFNMWTWNSRVFPGIDPLPVRLRDKAWVRMGNLTMTNHPIQLHGHHFAVSCTDGGWVPESRSRKNLSQMSRL